MRGAAPANWWSRRGLPSSSRLLPLSISRCCCFSCWHREQPGDMRARAAATTTPKLKRCLHPPPHHAWPRTEASSRQPRWLSRPPTKQRNSHRTSCDAPVLPSKQNGEGASRSVSHWHFPTKRRSRSSGHKGRRLLPRFTGMVQPPFLS